MGLLQHRCAQHLYIYLTLFGLATTHRVDTRSRFPANGFLTTRLLGPHIRLMVDVLLTMNEAFCIAGVEFPVFRPKLIQGRSNRGISEKKHD